MIKISLREAEHLPHFLGNWSGTSDRFYFSIAEEICAALFDNEHSDPLKKAGIDPLETVFIGKKPFYKLRRRKFSRLTDKAYAAGLRRALLVKQIVKGRPISVSRLAVVGSVYRFLPPEAVMFELSPATSTGKALDRIRKNISREKHYPSLGKNKHLTALSRRLDELNHAAFQTYVKEAQRELDFIVRFNAELFLSGFGGRSHSFLGVALEGELLTAFCAACALTRFALSPEELFSVESVFKLQPDRGTDNRKKEAGVFALGLLCAEEKHRAFLQEICATIGAASLPALDLNDFALFKKNYPLYHGLGSIGRLLCALLKNEPRMKRERQVAELLSMYGKTAELCALVLSADAAAYRESRLRAELAGFAGKIGTADEIFSGQ